MKWLRPFVAFFVLTASLGALDLAAAGDSAVPTTARSSPVAISFGSGNNVGTAASVVQDLVAGDLDHDGNVDLVSAANVLTAWRNDGTPFDIAWSSNAAGAPGAESYALALADFDHDGNLDLASGSNSSLANEVQVWRNDGTPFSGAWTANAVGGGGSSVYGLAAADLDRDGAVDLVSGDASGQVIAWRNDGTPFSGAWSSNGMGSAAGSGVAALAVGDLDGDSDLDAVTGDMAGQVIVWQNDGTPFSGAWTSNTAFTAADDVLALLLLDLDGDGDLDLAAGCGAAEDYEVTSWENDGTPFSGSWVEHEVGKADTAVYALAGADFDVDGDPDLVSAANAHASYPELQAWENSGTPFASTWTGSSVAETGENMRALVAADLDQDGDPDLVSGSASSFAIVALPNQRPLETLSGWTEGVQPTTLGALSVALADFDFDGWTDVAAGTASNGLYVARGNGGYVWTQVGAGPLPLGGGWTGVDWGQINNVAGLDLAASSEESGLHAWASSQDGAVWDDISSGLPTTDSYQDVALGHVDHDGLLDVVACGKTLGVRVWEGLGSPAPYWGLQKVLSDTFDYCDVALGYIDHDGNLDIAAASCGGAGVHVWLGDGAMGFNPAAAPAANGDYEAVALGDVDDDGYVDLLAAPVVGGGIRFWIGDGGTSWTDKGTVGSTLSVLNLALDDFDRDGHLDILAGLQGGVRAWRGDGGGGWSAASTDLPTSGSYPGVAWGRVDGDGFLDVAAAELGAGGVHVWTPIDPPPGGWADFAPATYPPHTWANSRIVTATVEVADSGSGLNVDSGEYCFSRNGGATCVGGWLPAAVTGVSGTLDVQVVTAAAVPFDQDSTLPELNQNTIQFRIADMNGATGASPLYVVYIDSTPPNNPTTVDSSSHTVSTWDSSAAINVNWNDGTDATSGIYGYYYVVTNSASTLPDESDDATSGNSGVGSATGDGQNWYFHLRARDRAMNWASTAVHLGPFWVDITNPSGPTSLDSDSHAPGVWSNDATIHVFWNAASDGAGSGIDGYWYSWTHGTGAVGSSNTTALGLTSPALATAGDWYFNVQARDNVGRQGTALHLGPFRIDTLAPESSVSAPSSPPTADFVVSWNSAETSSPQAGVSSVDLQYRDLSAPTGATWLAWQSSVAANDSATFHGQHGHVYEFRSRARDAVGNVEDWPAVPDARSEVRTLDFATLGLEVTQAVQDLDNSVVLVTDKRTFVRFHVRSLAHGDQGPVTARLYGSRGGTSLGDIPPNNAGGAITVQGLPDRTVLEETFYFDLPSSWLHGTVQLTAIVNEDYDLAETDYANNVEVRTVTFEDSPEMNVLLVDICYDLSGTTYHVRDDDRRALASWLRRAYPIDRLNVWWGVVETCYDGAVDTNGNLTMPNSSEVNEMLEWNHSRGVLGSSEDPYTRYYGMANTAGGFMRGAGQRPGTVACGPAGAPGVGSWDSDGSMADWYGGHELAHTYNQVHTRGTNPAPCGVCSTNACGPWGRCGCEAGATVHYTNGQISPNQDPYASNTLYGFDVETLAIYPSDWVDVMTYCPWEWVSDYTYEGIRNRMIAESGTLAAQTRPALAQEYVAVFGAVYTPTDRVELGTFYRVPDAWDVLGRVPGDYSIRLLDAGNGVLADYPFTPSFEYVDPGQTCTAQEDEAPGLIAEYVPWVTGTARIAIYHGGSELASRAVSDHAPQVTLTAPNSGALSGDEIPVSWSASDADGDDLEYTLEYSVNGGSTWRVLGSGIESTSLVLDADWVPGAVQAKFRIVATDGVNSAQDESDGLVSVPNKAPQAWIISPADPAFYSPGQVVALIAETIDVEDGTLWDAGLTWTSSLSGTVGIGHMLHVTDLVTGTHVITLTASDSSGLQASATVTVHIGYRRAVYLPLVLRSF